LRHFHELLADTNDRVALFLLTESIKDLNPKNSLCIRPNRHRPVILNEIWSDISNATAMLARPYWRGARRHECRRLAAAALEPTQAACGHDRERDDDLPAIVPAPSYRHCEIQSAALTSKPIRMTAVIMLLSSSLPNSGRISHLLLKAFDPLSRS
jgi:hypothetical protein